MINLAAFQDERAQAKLPPFNKLVAAPDLLKNVWPDERSRPSLRWLRHQQRVRAIPWVRAGRRVLFCPAHVLSFVHRKLTVLPKQWKQGGFGLSQLPAADVLLDAVGLIEFLHRECGLKRSLRWLRQQQQDRTLPFLRWGRKIFFSPAQIRATLQAQAD
jgi:hypothetical protein